MARKTRLSLPGIVHYVVLSGHDGHAFVRDGADINRLLQDLRECALTAGVSLHAYAISGVELRVLSTPDSAVGISRMMQSFGRRYVAWFNRRHGRSGALWAGRFRSTLVEPGADTLLLLRAIDAQAMPVPVPAAVRDEAAPSESPSPPSLSFSSAGHRLGGSRDAALVDPAEYWQLGNTPFERESRWRELLLEPLSDVALHRLRRAGIGGGVMGSDAFVAALEAHTRRPLLPRRRGRPRRSC